jgi:hypothetical protein
MAKCENCGHDPESLLCKLCGAKNQTLGKFGDKILTICCQKDPFPKPSKGGK